VSLNSPGEDKGARPATSCGPALSAVPFPLTSVWNPWVPRRDADATRPTTSKDTPAPLQLETDEISQGDDT